MLGGFLKIKEPRKVVSGGFSWRVSSISSGPFNLLIKQFPTMKTLDPEGPPQKKNSCSTQHSEFSAPAQLVTSLRVLVAQVFQQAAPGTSSPARPVWHRAFAFTSSCLTPRGRQIHRTLVPSGNQHGHG